MSDTPETDAQLTTFASVSKLKKHFVNRTGTVSAEFARKLERERNEARNENLGWGNKWKCAIEMAARAEVERDEARLQYSTTLVFCQSLVKARLEGMEVVE